MKPEHRHELKTNELAEWLSNLPQWARKNLTTIIYVSVVTVVVIIYSFWYYYQKDAALAKKQLGLTKLIRQLPYNKRQILQAQSQGVDISYTLIQTADSLQAAAQDIKDPLKAASALIKRADTLRMELHFRPGTVSKSAMVDQINRAKAAYKQAIEKAASNPSLTATAQFGLGLCEEELGNIAEAQQIYRDLATSHRFECTTAAVQAKIRLDSIAQYQQKIVFKAPAASTASDARRGGGAKPEIRDPALRDTSPLSTPQIKLNLPDSNAE
jgi:tetratricopeptide (TPR) repeat protein